MKKQPKTTTSTASLPAVASHHHNVIQNVRRVSLWHEVNDRVNSYLQKLNPQAFAHR